MYLFRPLSICISYSLFLVSLSLTQTHTLTLSHTHPPSYPFRDSFVDRSLMPLLSTPPIGAPIPVTPDMEAVGLLCSESEISEYQVN